MEIKDYITLVTGLLGSVVGIFLTRLLDKKRLQEERKLQIFRALIKDRYNSTSYDFVAALNLIEIEFYCHPPVVKAWRDYNYSLNRAMPEIEESQQRLFKEWATLRAKLISEVGKAVDLPIDQIEIMQGGYAPMAWANKDSQDLEIRNLILKTLKGENLLKVNTSKDSSKNNVS